MKGQQWIPRSRTGVVKRYEEGETMEEIAESEGVSRLTVGRFLHRRGIRVRSRADHHRLAAGATRRTKHGYVLVKTRNGAWRTRQHVEWTKVHGPVPPGCIIMRLRADLPDAKVDNVENLVQMQMMTRTLVSTPSGGSLQLSKLPNDRNIRLLAAAAAALQAEDDLFKAGRPPR